MIRSASVGRAAPRSGRNSVEDLKAQRICCARKAHSAGEYSLRRRVAAIEPEAQPHLRQDSQRTKDALGRPDPKGVMAYPVFRGTAIPVSAVTRSRQAMAPGLAKNVLHPSQPMLQLGPDSHARQASPALVIHTRSRFMPHHQHPGLPGNTQPITARFSVFWHAPLRFVCN